MRKLLLAAATVITSLGLVGGASATSSGGSIQTTGPGSHATIKSEHRTTTKIKNHNSVDVRNHNSQRATSGDAKVWRNTTGGSATTGTAGNENSFKLKATIHNNTAETLHAAQSATKGLDEGGSISNTGPDSHASIRTNISNHTNIHNSNNVEVSNSNYQSARSGDATVSNNTTAGDATSGDAYNTNSTSINLNITN